MKIKIHGAGQEVGRSCIEVISDDLRFLFDCGLKISEEGSEYPELFDAEEIEAVFISHAHLDHSGALPLFQNRGLNCPVFCTSLTRLLTKILLKDSLHIQLIKNENPAYRKSNITNIISYMENVKFNKKYRFKDVHYQFFNAGHIPGSASVLVETSGKRILYTGDINLIDTELLDKANTDYGPLDVMICETTYGDREHPNREKEEKNFINEIKKAIDKGGSVIIPAFGVDRSQQVIMMLSREKFPIPVYLDGMAKKVTQKFLEKPEFLKHPQKLRKAFKKVTPVQGFKHRLEVSKQRGIFVTTSGMLDGGPVIEYLKYLWHDPNSSILLTGYQVDGTNGRLLMDTGKIFIDGQMVKVKCNVRKFDFSAHAGLGKLKNLIKKTKPKHLILNHGDPDAIKNFAKVAREYCSVFAPKLGDTIDIS